MQDSISLSGSIPEKEGVGIMLKNIIGAATIALYYVSMTAFVGSSLEMLLMITMLLFVCTVFYGYHKEWLESIPSAFISSAVAYFIIPALFGIYVAYIPLFVGMMLYTLLKERSAVAVAGGISLALLLL
jgi:hypothetical protein